MATDADAATAMADAALDIPDLVAMVVPASFSLWADRAIGRVLGDGSDRPAAARSRVDLGRRNRRTTPAEFWRWQRRFSGNNVMALGILAESLGAGWASPNGSPPRRVVRPREAGAGRGPSCRPTCRTMCWRSPGSRAR